jgi:hypothetical protein
MMGVCDVERLWEMGVECKLQGVRRMVKQFYSTGGVRLTERSQINPLEIQNVQRGFMLYERGMALFLLLAAKRDKRLA